MRYKLEIKPAIPPRQRHKIETGLEEQGFQVHGGGTNTDMSCCDISFSDAKREPVHTTKGVSATTIRESLGISAEDQRIAKKIVDGGTNAISRGDKGNCKARHG